MMDFTLVHPTPCGEPGRGAGAVPRGPDPGGGTRGGFRAVRCRAGDGWWWRVIPRQWAVVRVRARGARTLGWALPLAPLEDVLGGAAAVAALLERLAARRRGTGGPGPYRGARAAVGSGDALRWAAAALESAAAALRELRRAAPGPLLEVAEGEREIRIDLW